MLQLLQGGSIGTGVYVQRAKMTAEVMSVADLNSGYWGDDVNSSGMITNDYSQSVEITNTDEIKEVYVKEGQQVQKGDKLLALDTTVASLNLQGKQLEVENLNNQITIAQNDLKKLKNTETNMMEPANPVTTRTEYTTCAGDGRKCIQLYFRDAVPYNQNSADGSEENPYRYLCTESAYVTGDFLSQLAEEKTYAVSRFGKIMKFPENL